MTNENLSFAKAEVVRLMKQYLDDDKIIREQVKIGMNNFLAEILENVCQELNKYPYSTIEYEMLKECTYPYTHIKRINEEKKRLLKHMDSIKSDCDALSMDINSTIKLTDNKNEFSQEKQDDLFYIKKYKRREYIL